MKDFPKLSIRDTPAGAVISVKVVPGSSRDQVVGVLGEDLKIATAAPAEKGRANNAVIGILARAIGVGTRDVQLVAGTAAARKEFLIRGKTAEQIREALTNAH